MGAPGAMPPRPMGPMAKHGGRIHRKEGGRTHKDSGGKTTNQKMKEGIAKLFTSSTPAAAEPSSSAPTPSPTKPPAWHDDVDKAYPPKASGSDSDGDSDTQGEKRGGSVHRKHNAKGGGLTSAGPLDYDGPKTQGNSAPSWHKNDGSSNEKETGEHSGGIARKQRASGGGLKPAVHITHGSAGGLGRLDKAKIYGASHHKE